MGKPKKQLPRWVETAAYYGIRGALAGLGAADMTATVRAARSLGRTFAGTIGRSRLGRAESNIAVAFPDSTAEQRHEYAVHAYEHLFQLGVEMVHSPRRLTPDGWARHVRVGRLGDSVMHLLSGQPSILVTGHAGNWELLAYIMALLGFPMHVLYRPLDLRPLDTWVRQTRQRRGLVLMDKFGAIRGVPRLLGHGAPVGFAADQNGGHRGLFVPFFNRLASSYKSIGLMAIRFETPIICGLARRLVWERDAGVEGASGAAGERPTGASGAELLRRLGPRRGLRQDEAPPVLGAGAKSGGGAMRAGIAALSAMPAETGSDLGFMTWTGEPFRYRLDVVDVIEPKDWVDQPDPLFYVTARYRRAIEKMVRLAPEQYLWMHRYWKSRPRHERQGKPLPGALREKIAALPWTTASDLEQIEEWSKRDAAEACKE